LKAGETTTVGVVVDNVEDLFSIPFLMQYDPAVISVEEVGMAASSRQVIKRSRSCSKWTKNMVRRSFRQRVSQTRQE
jgi:Cohesin domain